MHEICLHALQKRLHEEGNQHYINVSELELFARYRLLVGNDEWVDVVYIGKTHTEFIFQTSGVQYVIDKCYSNIYGVQKTVLYT